MLNLDEDKSQEKINQPEILTELLMRLSIVEKILLEKNIITLEEYENHTKEQLAKLVEVINSNVNINVGKDEN